MRGCSEPGMQDTEVGRQKKGCDSVTKGRIGGGGQHDMVVALHMGTAFNSLQTVGASVVSFELAQHVRSLIYTTSFHEALIACSFCVRAREYKKEESI